MPIVYWTLLNTGAQNWVCLILCQSSDWTEGIEYEVISVLLDVNIGNSGNIKELSTWIVTGMTEELDF